MLIKQDKALRTIGTEEGVIVVNDLEYCEDRINGVSVLKDQVSVPVIHMVDEVSVPEDEVSVPGPPRDKVSHIEGGQTPIPEHPKDGKVVRGQVIEPRTPKDREVPIPEDQVSVPGAQMAEEVSVLRGRGSRHGYTYARTKAHTWGHT